MNRHLAIALSLAVTLPLAAQEPTPTPAPAPTDGTRTAERAQTMREQIDGGRAVRSHVRVLVRLKNGNKLRGIVKDGRFVERVDGLRFVDAQAKDRGAGIRLWYTSGANNYVFVPFSDFAEYTVLQRITADELTQLEQQMQMEDARKAERLAAAARTAKGGAAGQGPAPTEPGSQTEPEATETPPAPGQEPRKPGQTAGEAGTGATSEADQQKVWFQLLQDYPPKAGWNRARRDEIARRKVVVGANPSPQEQKFVEQFAEWEKACQHFGVDPAAKPAGGETTEETTEDSRRSRRRRR